MPVPIVIAAIYAWFMRVVVGFIGRRIVSFLISQIISLIIVSLASGLLVSLSKTAKELLKKMNTGTMVGVFKIENIIWETYSFIFKKLDNFLIWLDGKFSAILDVVNVDEIEACLSILNFGVWIDGLVAEIVTAMSDTIRDVITQAITPFASLLGSATEMLEEIEQTIDSVESEFNAHLDSLFATIATAYDTFDQAIVEIASIVAGLKWAAIQHNTQLADNKTQMVGWLEQELIRCGIQKSDITQITSAFSVKQSSVFTPISVGNYDIDWANYRWVNECNRADYLLAIDIPALVSLKTTLVTATTDLNTLAETITQDFIDMFPAILRGKLEDRIKVFVVLAICQIIVEKKALLQGAITEKRAELDAELVAKKEEIKGKVEKIKEDIQKVEEDIIDMIPDSFETLLQKTIRELGESIVASGDEVLVNIDQFIPDMDGIDSILESFPSDIKANPEPNISDSATFSIQDIYRLLCNNFYRSERISLIVILATQDFHLSTEELGDWLDDLGDFSGSGDVDESELGGA